MLPGTDLPRPRPLAGIWAKILRNPSALIIANTATQSVLRLVSSVILARLLAPSDFALIAITMFILTGLHMISDVGIAIIALREGEMSEEDEARLWTMQLVRGVGMGVFVVAAAVPIGWLYGDERVRDVLFGLAAMPVLQGAQSLYPIMALRHRRLLPSTLLEVGGRVLGIIASVLFALVNPTVWSLVVGTLLGVAVGTIGSHVMAGRPPRFIFDLGYMTRQWRFSRWIQASSTLHFVGMQLDKALFPFLFGLTALGVYGIGATFAAMPAQVTQRWSGSVFYPLATQLLRGGGEARAQLIGVRTTMLLYTAIVCLAVAAISPAFFLLLYEPQYHAAARFAQILAIATFFEVAESSLRHFPLVDGTARYEVWPVVIRLTAFAVAALAAAALGAGIPGYAASYVIGSAASHQFMLAVGVRRGYLRPGTDLLLTVGLAAAAVAIYFAPLPTAGVTAIVTQGIAVGVAATLALLVVYIRRGLPSLPAEPAPATLRETAEEELGPTPTQA